MGPCLVRDTVEDRQWFVGTFLLGMVGLVFTLGHLKLAENQAADRKERAAAKRDAYDQRARHMAVRVHESAADAFVFSEHAHRDAVRTNYLSAKALSEDAMTCMKDAHDLALREDAVGEALPRISDYLHPALKLETLVLWRAVTLYYAASAALHTVDEEFSAMVDSKPSARKRRTFARDTIQFAQRCLAQAEARASHVDKSVRDKWEPHLQERIALRRADANSFWKAVCDDPKGSAGAYDEEEPRRFAASSSGTVHLHARFHSNHAMALFGSGDHENAVKKLTTARELLARSETATRRIDKSTDPLSDSDKQSRSARTFEVAFKQYCRCKGDDRMRILSRKRLSVPCMLLFVASFVESTDLVPLVDDVLGAVESFLGSNEATIDDTAWLERRGLVRVLVALFMALEACPTDDVDAANSLADDVIGRAAKLAMMREELDCVSRAGDFGAFACSVVQGRPPHNSWLSKPEAWRPVQFSELSRAKRMEKEAESIRRARPDRRTEGAKLTASHLERIRAALARTDALP